MLALSAPPLDFLPSDLPSQPVALVPDRGLKPHQCTSRPLLFVGAAVDVRARRGVAARCCRARRRRGLAERDRKPGDSQDRVVRHPAAAGVQPRLLTLTAAALERSTASPAEQVFACTAIGGRYSPNPRPVSAHGPVAMRKPRLRWPVRSSTVKACRCPKTGDHSRQNAAARGKRTDRRFGVAFLVRDGP